MITDQEISDRFRECGYDVTRPNWPTVLAACRRGDIMLVINLTDKPQYLGGYLKEMFPPLTELFPTARP